MHIILSRSSCYLMMGLANSAQWRTLVLYSKYRPNGRFRFKKRFVQSYYTHMHFALHLLLYNYVIFASFLFLTLSLPALWSTISGRLYDKPAINHFSEAGSRSRNYPKNTRKRTDDIELMFARTFLSFFARFWQGKFMPTFIFNCKYATDLL